MRLETEDSPYRKDAMSLKQKTLELGKRILITVLNPIGVIEGVINELKLNTDHLLENMWDADHEGGHLAITLLSGYEIGFTRIHNSFIVLNALFHGSKAIIIYGEPRIVTNEDKAKLILATLAGYANAYENCKDFYGGQIPDKLKRKLWVEAGGEKGDEEESGDIEKTEQRLESWGDLPPDFRAFLKYFLDNLVTFFNKPEVKRMTDLLTIKIQTDNGGYDNVSAHLRSHLKEQGIDYDAVMKEFENLVATCSQRFQELTI